MPASSWTHCRYPDCAVKRHLRHGLCSAHVQRLTKLGHKSAELGTWTDAQIAEAAAAWDQRRARKTRPQPPAQAAKITGIPMADDDGPPAQPAPNAAATPTSGGRWDPLLGPTQIATLTRERDEAQRELAAVDRALDENCAPDVDDKVKTRADRVNALIGCWQQAIYETIQDLVPDPDRIDGAGSDGGPLELTLAEVQQGLAQLIDQGAEVQAKLEQATRDLAEATERATAREAELVDQLRTAKDGQARLSQQLEEAEMQARTSHEAAQMWRLAVCSTLGVDPATTGLGEIPGLIEQHTSLATVVALASWLDQDGVFDEVFASSVYAVADQLVPAAALVEAMHDRVALAHLVLSTRLPAPACARSC